MTGKKEEPVVVYRGDGFNLKRNNYDQIILEYPVAGCWYNDKLCVASKEHIIAGMFQDDIDEELRHIHEEEWGWELNFNADAIIHTDYEFDPNSTNNDCFEITNSITGVRKEYARDDPDYIAYTSSDGEELYEAFIFNRSSDPIKFTIGFVSANDLN